MTTGTTAQGKVDYYDPHLKKYVNIEKSEALTVGLSYVEEGKDYHPIAGQISENSLRTESEKYNQRARYDTI